MIKNLYLSGGGKNGIMIWTDIGIAGITKNPRAYGIAFALEGIAKIRTAVSPNITSFVCSKVFI
jgi:hypothetical protein